MLDTLTIQRLVESGQYNNSLLKEKLETVMNSERTLDGPPEKYAPLTLDIESVQPFGAYSAYRREYTKLLDETPNAECCLMIDGKKCVCEYKLFVALKALINCGVTKSQARAVACRELFGTIISHARGNMLTLDAAQPALRTTGDYYKNELIHAMVDSIYSPREQVVVTLKAALGDEYGDDVISLLEDPEDVDALDETVKKVYKRACCDPEFRVRKHLGRTINVVRYLREKK